MASPYGITRPRALRRGRVTPTRSEESESARRPTAGRRFRCSERSRGHGVQTTPRPGFELRRSRSPQALRRGAKRRGSADAAAGRGRVTPTRSEESESARRPTAGRRFRCSERSRGDRIRTCGLLLPKQALYQAELHPADALGRLGSGRIHQTTHPNNGESARKMPFERGERSRLLQERPRTVDRAETTASICTSNG